MSKDFWRLANIPQAKFAQSHSLVTLLFCHTLVTLFNWIHSPCKAEQPRGHGGSQRKRSTKRLKHTKNLFRKNLQLKGVC